MHDTERKTASYSPELAGETVPQSTPPKTVPLRIDVGSQIDDFDLLAKIGEGSFAQVFLARQVSMQRLVALKVSAERGAEPQTLAQLDHPHIVRVYDVRSHNGLRLLYMPFLAGGTLRDVLKLVRRTPVKDRTGKLILQAVDASLDKHGIIPPTDSLTRISIAAMSWPEAVAWLGSRLAEALHYAHLLGVLHRDLKPANVLLGADATPRLADFNVSSSMVEGDMVFGGSFAYMSPEQLEAFNGDRGIDDLDGRSDIYALAVSLWELLTGERPFPDEPLEIPSMLEERRGGLNRSPAFPLLPGMLDVLRTCLQFHRDDRYATAFEVARQFDLCRMPATRELLLPQAKWVHWVRRHPMVAVYTAALVPNIAAAIASIEYNRATLVDHYPAASGTFKLLQGIVNGTFFPLCIAWFAWYFWPVLKGLKSGSKSEFLRRRSLRLGFASFVVILTAWVSAGVIFPLTMHFSVHELPIQFHLHFLASQTLCGLIAVTYPQFGITYISLRCFYTAFVENLALTPADVTHTARLDRSQSLFLGLASAVPPVGILLLVGFGAENPLVLAVLCFVGVIGYLLAAYVFVSAIRSAVAALQASAK